MSAETHSVKAKVASDGPSEAPAAPEQSDAQNTTEKKDTNTLFKEAFERANNRTREERMARHPSWENMTPRGTSPATAFRVMEEMERAEAALPDLPPQNGPHNAS